jgi:hypothetical protein
VPHAYSEHGYSGAERVIKRMRKAAKSISKAVNRGPSVPANSLTIMWVSESLFYKENVAPAGVVE